MEWKTMHCSGCGWEGNKGDLVLLHRTHMDVIEFGQYGCPTCYRSNNLVEGRRPVMIHALKKFSDNMETILKNMEEKEKKREISKIINSLQTPFTQVMSMIEQEVSNRPRIAGTKFTIKF